MHSPTNPTGIPSGFEDVQLLAWIKAPPGQLDYQKLTKVNRIVYHCERKRLNVEFDSLHLRFDVSEVQAYASNSAPGKVRIKFMIRGRIGSESGVRKGESVKALGLLVDPDVYLEFATHAYVSAPHTKVVAEAHLKEMGIGSSAKTWVAPNKHVFAKQECDYAKCPMSKYTDSDWVSRPIKDGRPTIGTYTLLLSGRLFGTEYRSRADAVRKAQWFSKAYPNDVDIYVMYVSARAIGGNPIFKRGQSPSWV